MEWKVKKVKKDGLEKYMVKPVLDKSAKGNVWFKIVEEIDWTRDNGYSFIGQFMPWWLYSEIEDGQVVLYVDKRSGEAQVYQFENGQMVLKGRYDYKSAFKELRKDIDKLLTGGEVEEEEEVQEVQEDGVEKLIVEFDVEKTIQRDYGYAEKFLSYRGEKTKYKAILKDGKLVAIVSRRFYLLENERLYDIVKKYGEDRGYEVSIISQSFTRIHVLVKPPEKDYAVVVHNSVDGSMALRVDLLIRLKSGVYTVFRVRDVSQVYRKHTKNLMKFIEELVQTIDTILDGADRFKKFISSLDDYKISDLEQDIRDTIEAVFPKKHWEGVWYKYKRGQISTLKEMYENFAEKIWQDARLDFKTKVDRFDKMNQWIFVLIGIESF